MTAAPALLVDLPMPALLTLPSGVSVGTQLRRVAARGFHATLPHGSAAAGDILVVRTARGAMREGRVVLIDGKEVRCDWHDPRWR